MGAISKEMKTSVLNNVTIPEYFKSIILKDIPEFYSDYSVDFEARPVVKCPLHGENTPSLRYYEETNSFYCFGCRVGGDIIKLHMEYMDKCVGESVTFPAAVEFLYKRFIEGRQVEKAPQKNYANKVISNTEYKSTIVEIMMFNRYTNELETRLMRDREMAMYDRVEMYIFIEEIEKLVSTNTLNAKKAIDILKSKLNSFGQ